MPNPSGYPEVGGTSLVYFHKNASSTDGGAIEAAGRVEVKRAHFSQNVAAQDGGAIDVFSSGVVVATPFVSPGDPAGQLTQPIAGFYNNKANRGGGAIRFQSGGTSTLIGVSMTGNTAVRHGGALRVTNGTVDITDSFVTHNKAGGSGGGIMVGTPPPAVTGGTVNATRVTFEGNTNGPFNAPNNVIVLGLGVFNETNCIYL